MVLTPELVAHVHRALEGPGPDPNFTSYTDREYDAAVREILAMHPVGEDLWLFAYGSLIWNPAAEHIEERIGTVRGWHRAFCLRIMFFRATQEQPGLMMALDRGGQCRGVVYRLADDGLEAQLGKLLRREMPLRFVLKNTPTSMPRWMTVETGRGPVRAIAFVANPKGGIYVGRLPLEQVADVLARACGPEGSCAEYLQKTVAHLEGRGIHDRNLWKLQQLVAARIKSLRPVPSVSSASPSADR